MAKGAESTIKAVAEICRDLLRFMGVTPPCFKIPNADLTTHLPRSGSATQVLSASNVPPGLL
ncbi:unnamed protein product [Prunus armeniaca]